jgi:hypothetical protein
MPSAAANEYWAAEQALLHLQRKLATLPEWRDSLAWEAVERTLEVLRQGWFDAYEIPTMPKDFVHWREKYPPNFEFSM